MNNVKKNLYWQCGKTAALLYQSLKNNHVSITTTDTILGFLAPLSQLGFEALNELKGGRQQKPYLILIESTKKLYNFVDEQQINDQAKKLMADCWPGPVTLIFKAKKGIASYLLSSTGTIAIRCPDHSGLQQILKSFDGLFSTSANYSGQQAPTRLEELDETLVQKVDFVIGDEKCAHATGGLPSTILDVSDGHTITVVRQGSYLLKI